MACIVTAIANIQLSTYPAPSRANCSARVTESSQGRAAKRSIAGPQSKRTFLQRCLGWTRCQEPSLPSLLPQLWVLPPPQKASHAALGRQPSFPRQGTAGGRATRPFLEQMNLAQGQDKGKRSFLCQEAKWHRTLGNGNTCPLPGGSFQPAPARQMQRPPWEPQHSKEPASVPGTCPRQTDRHTGCRVS